MSDTLNILEQYLAPKPTVQFEEYLFAEDFCNLNEFYKYWKDNLGSLPMTLSELIVKGSLGGGKSYSCNYYLSYRVYDLFNSGNPQKQLGLADDSEIFGFYFTVSMMLAKASGFTHLYNIFNSCKWFKNNHPMDTHLTSVISFPDMKFSILAGSDFGHQLGLNVWCFILDEANFRNGVGLGMASEYAEVTQLYQQLIDRQLSRMSNADGSLNALAILISSASYETSFVEKRISQTKGNKNTKVINSVAYEIRPERYPKERFEVFIGVGTVEPCIVNSEEHKQLIIKQAQLDKLPDVSSFFRTVPVNLKPQFESNIVLALQNHCGVPTVIQGSFMVNQTYLHKSYVSEEVIPLVLQSESLEASTGDDTQLIEYLIPENIINTENPHSLFLDLSVQKDTGCLVCFRYDGVENGVDIHTKVFELKILPAKFPNATKISKVHNFVVDLASYMNIVAFGTDQYQSTEARQEVQAQLGIDDIRVSIDSSDIPHLMWSQGLVDGSIRQRRSELLEQEVVEAKHDYKKHRIIKQEGSSDDTMQANVGAYFLSATVGKDNGATLSDLYDGHINLVGGRSINRMLSALGYTS